MKKMEKSKVLLNVLCLEDELKDTELLNEMLVDAGYLVNMDIAAKEKEYLSFLKGRNYDIILADYTLPGFDVHTALKLALELQPEAPFICVSGTIGDDLAVELLKQGATDYVLKDRLGRLAFAVRRALEGVANQKEWKKANEALKESEESYRKLFENHSAVKIILDPDTGAIFDANDAAAQYYGWTREELKHMKIYQINTLSPEEVNVEMERARSKRRIHFEFRHRRADGSIRDVEVFSSKIEIRGKDVLHTIIHDITERKQSEEMLRESKVKYQTIFESTGTATFVIDEDTTILMANNECYSVMGYTATEIIGQKWSQHVAPESLQEMLKNHQLRRQNPDLAPKKYEVKLVIKGEILDGIVDIGMIPGTKQSIVSILDITERKRAEQELILANKEFVFQNEEKEKRAGELIIANNELAFQNEEKEKRAGELIIANKELVFQNEEKEKRAGELIIANKELAFQNREKEKRAEELIIAKEHAEESDRLKSAFLANMSHEIRTPMNGILGFAELLKEPDLTSEEQQEYIQIIEKSGARMLNIINDIVDISKIEAGLMIVNNKDTNINEKIEFIYIFFKPQVEEKGMQFFFKNTLPTKEATIRTDSEKVYSILTNLVKNAIKYSKEGAIEFGYIKKDETLEFYVKDTGIGIGQEHQKIIFDRFRQASESLFRKYEGAGLGLSISKAYVEMLGGKIWVESEEGIGSTFYFTLPYNVLKFRTNKKS